MSEDPKTLKQIVLEKWVPALITAGIGGLLVALVAPVLQVSYSRQQAISQRRLELWEEVGRDFTSYISARRRLNTAARHEADLIEAGSTPDAEFKRRKESYRQERDAAADKLRHDLILAKFHFGDDVGAEIDAFYDWHSQFRTATLEQLPPDAEYAAWREKLMLAIRERLQ